MQPFVYETLPARVIFGAGTPARLGAAFEVRGDVSCGRVLSRG
jgi:hypothetical protein